MSGWDTPIAPAWRTDTTAGALAAGLWCQLSPDPAAIGRRFGGDVADEVIGRAPPAGQPVEDRWMSRAQLSVARLTGGAEPRWRVAGLSARAPTSVNGRALTGPTEVKYGDVVRAGASLFVVGVQRPGATTGGGLVGASAELEAVRDQVRILAAAERSTAGSGRRLGLPVHVTGETGVGKDVVVRDLHAASGRTGALVTVTAVNLTAARELVGTPEAPGPLRLADGGTLCIDEVSELAPELQAAVVGALETAADPARAQDVRLVTTSNRDLAALTSTGRFRLDLWHRLAAARIDLPPLRARRLDILPIAVQTLARLEPRGMTALGGHADGPFWLASCLEPLVLHAWPGNVRELENACAVIAAGHLARVSAAAPLPNPARVVEAWRGPINGAPDPAPARDRLPPIAELTATLHARFGGNVKAYAEALAAETGLPASSVRRRMYDAFRAAGVSTPERSGE